MDLTEVVRQMALAMMAEPAALGMEVIQTRTLVVFELMVGPVDYGHLVGRDGRLIQALRELVASMGARAGFRTLVLIHERTPEAGEGYPRPLLKGLRAGDGGPHPYLMTCVA